MFYDQAEKTFMNIFAIHGKNYQQLPPLFLRLTIGFGFMAHGWAKFSRGPEGLGKLLTQLHVPFPDVMAWVTTTIEIIGGLALFVGAFVGLAAIPLIFTMLVAMVTIHIHYGYSSIKTVGLSSQGPLFGPPGYEINLLYIAGLIALIFSGAGRFSVDAALVTKRKKSE
ncbi:MAG: DoxX family protein [Ginsengibacter sp.]